MDIEIYFESAKVSKKHFHNYEKDLEGKINEIKSEISKRLYEIYSLQIDIKNNCIINNIIDGKSKG